MITLVTMAGVFNMFRHAELPIEYLKRYVDERVEEEMWKPLMQNVVDTQGRRELILLSS
jgi:hypothetical protein